MTNELRKHVSRESERKELCKFLIPWKIKVNMFFRRELQLISCQRYNWNVLQLNKKIRINVKINIDCSSNFMKQERQ